MMELIERSKLRDSLLYEQAKYMMSEHEQNKHTSAGFLLAVAELDSQPNVDAIPVKWIAEYIQSKLHHTVDEEVIQKMIREWRADHD